MGGGLLLGTVISDVLDPYSDYVGVFMCLLALLSVSLGLYHFIDKKRKARKHPQGSSLDIET